MLTSIALTLVAFAFGLVLWINSRSRRHVSLPPGPPADPLIGHLRIIPQDNLEGTLTEWAKIYGDVIHLHVPRRSIIALSSYEAAVDLLERRSYNYSDRPYFLIFELMGFGSSSLAIIRYGKHFQAHRKMFQYFSRENCEAYQERIIHESRRLLTRLLRSPQEHEAHLHHFIIAIVIKLSYGHSIALDTESDPYVKMGQEIVRATTSIGAPGNTAVDFLPILQYFPSWFPGTYYANLARQYRPLFDTLREFPLKEVQKQMAEGTAEPSFLSHLLETHEELQYGGEITNYDIQGACTMAYAAGTDTTASTLSTFLLCMVLYPECQVKTQTELDAVVGPGRLPTFEDQSSLPYLNNLILECYRFNPVAPLGVPHVSMEDDVYRGMFIPKGSLVISNIRGMYMNENIYANPAEFNPDRYLPKPLGSGEPVPNAHFGFGRRICPGRYLADMSLFMAYASILSAFSIKKAVGPDGKEITPEAMFTAGITSHPKEYKCSIVPRNASSQSLLDEIFEFKS